MNRQDKYRELTLDTMDLDDDLLAFLASVNCLPPPEHRVLLVLYREASKICSDNGSGNFLVIGEDALASLVLAWVIRNKTAQPRNLFISSSVYQQYAYVFNELGRGSWIKRADGLLQERDNARNWLGMLELLYVVDTSKPVIAELLLLLHNQLQQGARIILEKGEVCQKEQLHQQLWGELQEDNSEYLLAWKSKTAINDDIPAYLIEQFNQDDPVAAGIPTMMSPNERFQLYYAIRQLLPMNSLPLRFIEVGSFAGGTFYETCMALKRMQLPYQGIAVEPFPGEIFNKVIDFFKDNSLHLKSMSDAAAVKLTNIFQYSSLPVFMLIDGDHSYEAVCQDIKDYYPMLAPGGIIMFHDYLPQPDEQNRAFIIDRKAGDGPSVGEACRELLEGQYGLSPIDLPLLYPSSPCQTLAYQAIIPGVLSTIRSYRKPVQ